MATSPTNRSTRDANDSNYSNTNGNEALDGLKVLSFPPGIGDTQFSPNGKAEQYMRFKINTDSSGAVMGGDQMTGPVTANSQYAPAMGSSGVGDTVTRRGLQSLDRCVIMPMPNDHNVVTALQYNTTDPDQIAKAGDIFGQIGSGGFTDAAKLAAGYNRLKTAVVGGGDAMSAKTAFARARMVENPKKEVLFDSFGFRSFSFMWTLAPKNAKESQIVQEILKTFRFYALPEISGGKLFYIFPAEFEISFILGSADNPNVPRIATSVLEQVRINYSPAGTSWATLPDGMPVQINLALDFKEIELVDRIRVNEGY